MCYINLWDISISRESWCDTSMLVRESWEGADVDVEGINNWTTLKPNKIHQYKKWSYNSDFML